MKVSDYFEQKFFEDFDDLNLVRKIGAKLKNYSKNFGLGFKVGVTGEDYLQGFIRKIKIKVIPGLDEVGRIKKELKRLREIKVEFCEELEKYSLDIEMLGNIVRFNQEYRRPLVMDSIQSISFYRMQKELFGEKDKEVFDKLVSSKEKTQGIIESMEYLKNSIKCYKFILSLAQEESVKHLKSSFPKRTNNILKSNLPKKKRILIETPEKSKINLINFEPRLQSSDEEYKIEIKRLQTLSSSPSPYSLHSLIEKPNKRATFKPRPNCFLPNSSKSPKPHIFNRPETVELLKNNLKKDFNRVFLSPPAKRVTFSLSNERKNKDLGTSQ